MREVRANSYEIPVGGDFASAADEKADLLTWALARPQDDNFKRSAESAYSRVVHWEKAMTLSPIRLMSVLL